MGEEPNQDRRRPAVAESPAELRDFVEETYSADLCRAVGDTPDIEAVWDGYVDESLRAFVERYGRKLSCDRPRLRRRKQG